MSPKADDCQHSIPDPRDNGRLPGLLSDVDRAPIASFLLVAVYSMPDGLPRHPWAASMLAEQAVANLPQSSSLRAHLLQIRHPQLGFQRHVFAVLLTLARDGLLRPDGQGRQARVSIDDRYREIVRQRWTRLTGQERNALCVIGHRLQAASVALSNIPTRTESLIAGKRSSAMIRRQGLSGPFRVRTVTW